MYVPVCDAAPTILMISSPAEHRRNATEHHVSLLGTRQGLAPSHHRRLFVSADDAGEDRLVLGPRIFLWLLRHRPQFRAGFVAAVDRAERVCDKIGLLSRVADPHRSCLVQVVDRGPHIHRGTTRKGSN